MFYVRNALLGCKFGLTEFDMLFGGAYIYYPHTVQGLVSHPVYKPCQGRGQHMVLGREDTILYHQHLC